MKSYEELIHGYEVEVEFPDVSGMEHLHMLTLRSELAKIEPQLTVEQGQRLALADQRLFHQAKAFYQAIQEVADLANWRSQQATSPDHWWWYLDVIIKLPFPVKKTTKKQPKTNRMVLQSA